jgi:hypothetical protein
MAAQSGRPKTSARLSAFGKSGQTCSRGFDRIGREDMEAELKLCDSAPAILH